MRTALRVTTSGSLSPSNKASVLDLALRLLTWTLHTAGPESASSPRLIHPGDLCLLHPVL